MARETLTTSNGVSEQNIGTALENERKEATDRHPQVGGITCGEYRCLGDTILMGGVQGTKWHKSSESPKAARRSDETKSIQLARTRRVMGRREEKGCITHILLLQNGREELQRRTDGTELHIASMGCWVAAGRRR